MPPQRQSGEDMAEAVHDAVQSGRPRAPAAPVLAAVGAVLFALAALATLALGQATDGTVSLWIANALVVGYAIRRPSSPIAPLLVASFAGTLLSAGWPWREPAAVLVAAVANTVEVGIVLVLLRRMRVRMDEASDSARVVAGLLVAVLLAPMVGALVGVAAPGSAPDRSEQFVRWFLADAFGMFVVLPTA